MKTGPFGEFLGPSGMRMGSGEGSTVYRSPKIVRVIKSRRCAGHIARMGKGRSAFKVSTGKPTEKRPVGRPRSRWEDNIRMDLKEIGINSMNWVDSDQDRDYWRVFVDAAFNLHKLWS